MQQKVQAKQQMKLVKQPVMQQKVQAKQQMKLVKQPSNATEGASQAVNDTGSEMGQAADNATTSGNSSNPLEMLMNLFKGQN